MSDAGAVVDETEVGSYFVANYPPFSVWTKDAVGGDALPALDSPPVPGVPLGMYLHVPFCRKRCHFCYFRVYTDKNAKEVAGYLDTLIREWELYARRAALSGRPLDFVYFGGGTPSFLSTPQLEHLVRGLTAVTPWTSAEEITFECEPARALGFPQINLDLIAGMLGETDANWRDCIEKTLALEPDSVTVYQMELPFNTTISRDLLKGTGQFEDTVASWATKRRWVAEAFAALEDAGYHVGSAYTAVRDPARARFVYRDRLWQGADLVGLGVASFGHVNGVHVQNLDQWDPYREAVERGALPLNRAYRPTEEERLIRELVLQLKRGSVRPAYFLEKYGVDVRERFRPQTESLSADGFLAESSEERLALTREGLLRADVLLHRFFLPQHAAIRYT
jgi:oxygen-independent coproporphyrinogen III oxidase